MVCIGVGAVKNSDHEQALKKRMVWKSYQNEGEDRRLEKMVTFREILYLARNLSA
jgi:hypothetical protein